MQTQSVTLRSYLLKRILQLIPVLLGVVIVNFLLIHLAPGDPALVLAGSEATEDYLEAIRKRYGLDKPIHEQLGIYLSSILQGDLGTSYRTGLPVMKLIWERLPATLLLMATALILAYAIGVVLGVVAARKEYSLTDNVATWVALFGYSVPVFWLGQIFIIWFSLTLNILPTSGMTSARGEFTGMGYVLDVLYHLILPALTLTLALFAVPARLTRANMLEILRADYITTAKSKGLGDRPILYRHALRNALLPIITVLGQSIGLMFAGSVLTETVFAWPGIGRLVFDSILDRDYPTMMGLFIVISVAVVIANLITDIAYGYIDPRIRYR